MKQTTKFYLSSFLKNQTYFTPVFIVILQFYHLSFQEIFWVFTIGSIISVIIEIPTGIFADLYGKRKSIILSKFLIAVSFLVFGFSKSFWPFVLGQVLYEFGNSFRTGTETAYTFDYLKQNPKEPKYTLVKGNQKFWARIGESIASVIGGFIAKIFNYNMVFFVAVIPALLNFFIAISWKDIKEKKHSLTMKNSINLLKESLKDLFFHKKLFKITMNMTIFTAAIAAITKFIQPYMQNANIPIEWFGIISAIAFLLAAFSGKYSYIFQEKFGDIKLVNVITIASVIPMIILGLGYMSIFGVLLFFLIIIIENIRSPITNDIFHNFVNSEKRSTIGSGLSLSKSAGKIVLLPIVGFITDNFSMQTAIIFIALILLINGMIFKIKN